MAHNIMERRHLEEADRHIAMNAKRIDDQQELVEARLRAGLDTKAAVRLLSLFTAVQEQCTVHRRLILDMLAEPEPDDVIG